MHFYNHSAIGKAADIPVGPPSAVVSISPIVLACPDRQVDLSVRATLPATAASKPLPILLFSHGHGFSNHLSSLEGYAPLVEFYAAHGFAVLQPTHLSSRTLGIPMTADNGVELFVDSRAVDMTRLLDRLNEIETALHGLLAGRRLDRARIAIVGHSLGAFTASLMLGAVNRDSTRDGRLCAPGDARIRAGVIVGAPGSGGEAMSASGREMMPFYGPDFGSMKTPTLVVWGEEDDGPHLTVRGAAWHMEPYHQASGPKASFMVAGGRHGFGGISGWDAAETRDESPERLAAVQRVSLAYLQSQLYADDESWTQVCAAVEGLASLGTIENKA